MFCSLTSLIQKNNHRTRNHSLLWFLLVPTEQENTALILVENHKELNQISSLLKVAFAKEINVTKKILLTNCNVIIYCNQYLRSTKSRLVHHFESNI